MASPILVNNRLETESSESSDYNYEDENNSYSTWKKLLPCSI